MHFYSSNIEAQLILGKKNTTLSALARLSLEQCAGSVFPEAKHTEVSFSTGEELNFPRQEAQQATINALDTEQFRLLQSFLHQWVAANYSLPPLLMLPLASLARHKKRSLPITFRFLLRSTQQ